MKVMVLVKYCKDSEEGVPPNPEFMARVKKFNNDLTNAGVMVGVERLLPSVQGKKIRASGTQRIIIDGPFAETKEMVGGFWLWKVKSMEEAMEWARRCPIPDHQHGELELRPVLEADDNFGPTLTTAV